MPHEAAAVSGRVRPIGSVTCAKPARLSPVVPRGMGLALLCCPLGDVC